MTDPASTIVMTAFVVGAAKGATQVGEQAVVDAYATFKKVVSTLFGKATDLINSIAGFETKPESKARREVLAEELSNSGALASPEIVRAAEQVVSAAENSSAYQTIGINWVEVKAAKVNIGNIRAGSGAIGFQAIRSELHTVDITSVEADGNLGKK